MQKRKLREVGTIVSGATPKTTDSTNFGGDIPWITPADLSGYTEKYIAGGARNLTEKGYNSCSTQLMPANSVVFSSRAPIGYVAIAKNPLCTNQGFKSVIPDDGLDSEFLYYQLLYLRDSIREMGTGTTFKEISGKRFGEIDITVPSIYEQRRIVARIEELFSQLDNAEATLQKTKAQLALYRQAVLKEAFDGWLTNSALKATVRLGDYIETPRYGTSKKCSYDCENDKTAVYRIPNIDYKTGRISHNDVKYAQFSANKLDGIRLQQGDILIIRSNGSVSLVGRAAMVCATDTAGTFAGYLMRLRVLDTEKLLPEYLLLYLGSHQARIYIENKAKSTSGVHNINSTEISELRLPLYDKGAQHAIIEAVESRLSVCDNIEQTIDAALQQAGTLRQSILRDTLEGRL